MVQGCHWAVIGPAVLHVCAGGGQAQLAGRRALVEELAGGAAAGCRKRRRDVWQGVGERAGLGGSSSSSSLNRSRSRTCAERNKRCPFAERVSACQRRPEGTGVR